MMSQNRLQIGKFSQDIVELLNLDISPGTPIYISNTNISHIRERHADAYIRYFDHIEQIIQYPDYIGIAGVHAPSIEYVKCFHINGEIVNVAVRATKNGIYYIRSMFIIDSGRLNNYIRKGILTEIDK